MRPPLRSRNHALVSSHFLVPLGSLDLLDTARYELPAPDNALVLCQILDVGVRLQFVSEVDVIGLFQDITRLAIRLPGTLRATRVSLRTPPSSSAWERAGEGAYAETRGQRTEVSDEPRCNTSPP